MTRLCRCFVTCLAAVALMLVSSAGLARADSGSRDVGFGSAGFVYPWGTGNTSTTSQALASVVQPDGKLIVVGGAVNPDLGKRDFSVVRLNRDGTLDSTFGSGGRVYIDFGGVGEDIASTVRLLPGGSIVVAGVASQGTTYAGLALARLTSAGALDPTFGSGGKVRTTQSGAIDMVLTSTGQPVILSGSNLLRFTLTGAPDSTFGTNGVVSAFRATDHATANSLVLASGDAVVVGGYASPAYDGNHFALARHTSAGTLDDTFGDHGVVIREMGYKDNSDTPISRIEGLTSGPDGTLYAFGSQIWQGALTHPCCGTGPVPHAGSGAVLGRFSSSGAYMSQTLVSGSIFTPGSDNGAISAGGKLATATDGGLFGLLIRDRKTQLVRLTSAGAVDSTFGTGGFVDANFGAGTNDLPFNLVVQADGRPLVVGQGQESSGPPKGEIERFLAFTPTSRTLTVVKTGSGSGSVASSPAGISCGAACARSYPLGTRVTLTPHHASGSGFAGWSGACSGTSSCSVLMSGDRQVSAKFVLPPHTKIIKASIAGRRHRATFKFRGLGAGHIRLECKLDKGTYRSCRSPKTYAHLKPGRHTFRVRARNEAGSDRTPAKKAFKIPR